MRVGDWGGCRGGGNMRKTLTWRRPCQPDAVDPPGLLHLPPRRGKLCHKIRGKGEKSDASPKIRQGAWYADPFSETSKFVKSLPSLWCLVSTWICNKIFSKCIGHQNPIKAYFVYENLKHSCLMRNTLHEFVHHHILETRENVSLSSSAGLGSFADFWSQDLWLESKHADRLFVSTQHQRQWKVLLLLSEFSWYWHFTLFLSASNFVKM